MNCLIVGANFYNKGAQLMLLTLIEQLKENFDDVKICVSPTMGTRDELKTLDIEILDFPLLHVGSGKRFVYFLEYGNIIKLLKKRYRGNIKLKDVDVVFDLSGFAFGDQWGEEPTENLHLLIQKVKNFKIKYILMPQAFGPFNSKELNHYMKEVLKSADLIFARDKVSLQHLMELSQNRTNNVYTAPDITLFNKSEQLVKRTNCCIVPNIRMLDKGKKLWGDTYVDHLIEVTKKIVKNSDFKIILLVHDKVGGDYTIAKQVKSSFPDEERVCLFLEEDPIKIKSLISKSYFLVGSRFHALASALSTNVPCLGLGWSHKYKMLFEDYGISDFAYIEPNEEILKKVDQLLDPDGHEKIIHLLKGRNENLKSKNLFMWEKIKELIEPESVEAKC